MVEIRGGIRYDYGIRRHACVGKRLNMKKVRFKERWMGSRFVTALVSLSLCTAAVVGDTSSMVDLADSVIVSGSNARAINAAEFLQTEIQNRTGIILATSTSMPTDTVAAIVLGKIGYFPAPYALPPGLSVPTGDEGYALWVSRTARTAPTVYLVGRDDKGALFAAGMLIRKLDLARNYIRLDNTVKKESSPAYPMRGQQMLRSTQSEDGFVNWGSVEQLEQYIRDLALFGTNTIEPSGPDVVDEYLEELGIDLQVWAGGNKVLELNRLSDQAIRNEFSYLTGVDHFFTPGGDTSSSRLPMDVLPALERVGPLVMEGHPGSKWWYSNQCQDNHALDYDDYTFGYIQGNEPTWLYGMVYGPWTKRGIPEIRADLPSQYKIRHYPDICHVRWCQYVVPKWDRAWAQVWDRNKSIYAMPKMMRDIHNATRSDTVGFVSYNHIGSYNDLNKFIFSAMGWDPTADINDILYDYARVFFAYDYRNYPDGDFDHNMIVDMKDYALLARDWGTSELDVNSIVLWYKFDETSGNTANDLSGNGFAGAVVGDLNWNTGGYYDGCLNFNDHTRVEVPTDVLNRIGEEITFSFWINGNAASSAEWPNNWVFDIGDSSRMFVRVPDDSNNVVWSAAGDEVTWSDSNSADWYNDWVHYGFVKNAQTGSMRIYRNGQMVAQSTSAYNSLGSVEKNGFRIGGLLRHAYDLKASLDDFRVFNYALSEQEMTELAGLTPLNYGLSLWYRFDESSGNTASDSSCNMNDGTLYNMTDSDWITGKMNNTLVFDGVDDYVYKSALTVPVTGDMSLSCWINMTVANDAKRAIDLDGLQVRFDSEGRVGWDNSGGPDNETFSTDDVDDGIWHHVVFVRSGTNYQMYIDGQPDSTDTGAVESYGWIYCGRRSSGSYYTGSLDDVRVYNYALSGDGILYLSNGDVDYVNVPGSSDDDSWDSPADADNNGRVDANDLAILTGTWLDSVTEQEMIEACSEAVSQGLLLLGDNWIGPIADNTSAAAALETWKDITENMGGPDGVLNNWRLEMFLAKALIDAQVKRKYDAEMVYQQQAYDALSQAGVVGVSAALANARAALARIDTEFQSKANFKAEMQSWGVSGKYGELDETLGNVYQSLTDRKWIENRLDRVSSLADIEAILNYEDTGPGGFYDNLGAEGKQPHLVRQMTWQENPGFVHSPIEWNDHSPGTSRRQSQHCHATTRYDTPLVMRWEGLDPGATYHIEVVYLGPFGPQFTCETDDGYLIHGIRGNSGTDPEPYSIPAASTADGVLELEWNLTNVVRGVSVTEIWLKKD